MKKMAVRLGISPVIALLEKVIKTRFHKQKTPIALGISYVHMFNNRLSEQRTGEASNGAF